jgi:hypothetical protein
LADDGNDSAGDARAATMAAAALQSIENRYLMV